MLVQQATKPKAPIVDEATVRQHVRAVVDAVQQRLKDSLQELFAQRPCAPSAPSKPPSAWLSRLLARIADNAKVAIRDIRVCYHIGESEPAALELRLAALCVQPTDDQWVCRRSGAPKAPAAEAELHKIAVVDGLAVRAITL